MCKKYAVIILVAASMLTACAGVQIDSNQTQAVLAKSAARIFGYKMAESNPSIAPAAIQMCTMLTTGDPTQAMIDAAVSAAVAHFSGDPLMAASFSDLLSLVKIQPAGSGTAVFDPALVHAAALGCLEGIQMYQLQHSTIAKH